MIPSDEKPETGAVRYYLFNSLLHTRDAKRPFRLNTSDESSFRHSLNALDGVMDWEFAAYYLQVTYWPAATVVEFLDVQIGSILRERTAISCELFPHISDKQVSPYTVDSLKITPSDTLPDFRPVSLTQEESGSNNLDKFTKATPDASHRRVYDLCKNSHEHGESVPIVELNGGEYDQEAFRRLVEPLEEELMLLNGVLTARVVREQVEITYRAGLPLEVLDHFVGGVIGRFNARTKDDMSIFYQLKKGAPISLFINPRQACVC